jgi:arginine deiminase
MAKKIQVSSEIGNLKRVIVHRPDEGISRISPRKAEELLFDDIVHLPQMQQEHDVFTTLLEHFLGKENVLETEDLLKEAIENDRSTTEVIIDKIIIDEDLPNSFKEKLTRLPSEKLAKVLITGYLEDEDFYLFDPIPNFIFTRDIAVTINDHVVITKAAKSARARENFLTRLIFWAHPDFSYLKKEGKLINLNDLELFPPSR